MARFGIWLRCGAVAAACVLIVQVASAMTSADRDACTIRGTAGPDRLVGTEGADVICGGGGADRLDGRGGDDRLVGGGGRDWLRGGGGDDALAGGAGPDLLKGSRGADRLDGGSGADRLFGGAQADRLRGGAGNDRIGGGAGPDDLSGGPGRDLAYYGQRRRPIHVTIGDGANDGTAPGGGQASIGDGAIERGRAGERDDVQADVEDIRGGLGADMLAGDGGPNRFWGRGGDDRLTGGRGADRLAGGGGDDRLDAREDAPGGGLPAAGGQAAVDRVLCGDGNDSLDADIADVVEGDCENVSRPAGPPAPPQPTEPPEPTNHAPTDVTLSNARVDENQPAGTTVGTLAAVDPDSGDTHSFALVPGAGGADNGSFAIAGNSLRTAATFDFEAKSSYSIRVRARDARGATVHKVFAIAVDDLPENRPPTDIALDDTTVTENEPAGTTVGALTATDPDAGDTHVFRLVAGAGDGDNDRFAIAGGTLSTDEPLDHEHGAYSIRVEADDQHGGTFQKSFSITADDANDAPTAIAASDTEVDENEPAGTAVGTLSATDQDAGDTHTYSLVAGAGDADNGSFQISGSTLQTAASFNFEVKNSYSIRVRTQDSGSATHEQQLTVTVTDVPEAPTDIALSDASVPENEPIGTEVGTLSATDPENGPHTFALVAGAGDADNASFQIDGTALETNAVFDFDTKSSYTIRVRATDSTNLTFEKALTVTVTNVNEPPTAIALSDSSVPENEPAGTAVGTLSTTDPDPGDTHTYSLVSGTGDSDNASFQIDGTALETNAVFDFEVKSSYSVRVRTDDGAGGTFEQQLSISIANANDAPTAIAASDTEVDENEPAGTAVGTLSATDQDAGDTHTFSLVAGTGDADNGSFQISGTTLQTAASFNFEVKNSYSIRVRATDSGVPARTFERQLTITVLDVNDPPSAADDSHSGAIGNTRFAIGTSATGPVVAPAGALLLANDTDEDAGDTVSAVAEAVASTGGGSATINADGSFVFLPGVGDKNQSDTFTYKVTDGEAQDTGTVTVGIANELVWYVDDSAPAGGDGRSTAPLNSLATLNGGADVDGTGDNLFLYSGTYGGGLPLEASQRLIGEPHGLTLLSHALVPAGGTNPVISNAGGAGITLANNVEAQRVNVSGASGAGIAGTSITNATVGGNTSVSSTGNALDLSGAASGTIAVGSSLTSTGARPVSIQNRGGGSVSLTGAVSSNASGVLLNSNTGASISLTGGVTVSSGATDAFRATAGGTVAVTGAANTLAATSGSGLVVQNATIGASGLTFRSIASNGGSSSGIVLDDTGSSGGLTVTGNGTAGSGGTIANKTGADGSTTTGVGVYLNNTRSVSLARMQINGHGNYAIRGTTVNGFSLTNSVVNGTNGTNASTDEASVAFAELTGSATIADTTVSGGVEDNVQVRNTGGTLNRLTFDNATIGANSTADGNDGISLEGAGSGTFNVTVQNSTLTSAKADLFQHSALGNVQSDLDFTGNTLTNNHPSIVAGGGGVTIGAGNSGDLTYDISGNTMRDSKGTALVVGKFFGGAPGDGTATGTIADNVIGVSGVANSGAQEGSGIDLTQLARGLHTTSITNNQIRGYNNFGILLSVGGASETVTGVTHDGDLNATIGGNTIAQPGTSGFIMNGIHLNSGTNAGDGYDVCLNLNNNTVTGSGAFGGTDYRLRHRFETTVRLPGYAGAAFPATDADLTTYMTPRTNGLFTLSSTNSGLGGGFLNTSPAGSACAQP